MIEVGTKVNIKYRLKGRKKSFNKNGRVIGVYPCFILVRFKHHRECFRHIDIKNGEIECMTLEG